MKNVVNVLCELVEEVSKLIIKDIDNGKNVNIILNAYNYWLDQEREGVGYIFDLDNRNDFKYLVENDLITLNEIVEIMKEKSHLFRICDRIENLYKDNVNSILKDLVLEFLPYVFAYVGRCGNDSPYSELYDVYVTKRFEQDYFE